MLLAVGLAATPAAAFESNLPAELSEETETCLECHKDDNPGLYQQWGAGKHYGANVGCYECHRAEKDDPDVLRDEDHEDFVISTIVSPQSGRSTRKTQR